MQRRTHVSLLVLASAALLAGCGAKDDKKNATQAAAKVNAEEITVHQVNQVLARLPGIAEADVPRVRREVLNKLVDQQLAVEQALGKKLDRQPEVMAAIDAARREILARAYFDGIIGALPKPSSEEVSKYYADNPQLFAQRRIYNLQEIVVERNDDLLPALREQVAAAKSMEDVGAWLKGKGVRFSARAGVRPAEQVPLEILAAVHALKDGQSVVVPGSQGVAAIRVLGSQSAPLDQATALPRIQQFLRNQSASKAVDSEIAQLRGKAKIELVGSFAQDAEPAAKVEPVKAVVKTEPSPAGNIEKAVGGLK